MLTTVYVVVTSYRVQAVFVKCIILTLYQVDYCLQIHECRLKKEPFFQPLINLKKCSWFSCSEIDRVTAETDVQTSSVMLKRPNCQLGSKCHDDKFSLRIDDPTSTCKYLLTSSIFNNFVANKSLKLHLIDRALHTKL